MSRHNVHQTEEIHDRFSYPGNCVRHPYDASSFVKILFRLRGSIMPRIVRHLGASTLIAVVITVIWYLNMFDVRNASYRLIGTSDSAHRLLAVPLAFLLTFRSTVGIERYWEGRNVCNVYFGASINICRKAMSYVRGRDKIGKVPYCSLLVH